MDESSIQSGNIHYQRAQRRDYPRIEVYKNPTITTMPSTRQAVHATAAPRPNGNYSHVIRQGDTLHVAGWMGDDPETGKIVEGGIEAQTERAILNIKACLEAAGSSLDKVVRRRIYIIEMGQFRTVDEVWGRWFEEPWPVSTCVQIGALAKEGALVELEVVASV
ncbi:hypothetical protein M8818_004716 [Zalaria obscura]|uniref:Uncharacterized protein n=1 Tax=Zalaria obscura TaxID=2024903 RepID=A0ACC3SCQ4_9PEZI